MSKPQEIPLASPDIGASERELVASVLESGRLSLGPMQQRFEADFAAWLGVDDAVAVSSGTAALHLSVRALGWGEGDSVVTTPLTFVASSNCLLYEGAEPRFVDVDPITLTIDPARVEGSLEGAAGVLPVHLFGAPVAMEEIEALCSASGLPILEDACQALGATCADGTAVGARGNQSIFAFYANKQLTTGEGGMLIPATPKGAELARSERNQGRGEDMSVLEHERLGFNYRLSELACALGVAQVDRLDDLLTRRREVADTYTHQLTEIGGCEARTADLDGLVLPAADTGSWQRGWFVYPIRLPVGVDRARVLSDLAAAGIQSKAYLPCVHLFPFYRERFGFAEGDFPVAEDVARRSVALPFFGAMSDADVDRVTAALAESLGRTGGRA